MTKISWNDLKFFNSWEELNRSELNWEILNSDCVDILRIITQNNIVLPANFLIRLENLYDKSLKTYNLFSNNPLNVKSDPSITDKIKTIGAIIGLLGGILSIPNTALDLMDHIRQDKHQIEIQIHDLNIYLQNQNTEDSNSNNVEIE